MKAKTTHQNGTCYRIGSGSDHRLLPNANPVTVLRIRQGCGRGWYQVQLDPGMPYCDVIAADLICEDEADEMAIVSVTPLELPSYVDVSLRIGTH